jgi:hypothetical protein
MIINGHFPESLVAKTSPRGWDKGGNVVWTSFFARGYVHVDGHEPAPNRRVENPMAYKMEHYLSTRNNYRTIDDIIVTNLFCGIGKGWDIIVCGSIVQHEDRKTWAQGEAEKLLDGAC